MSQDSEPVEDQLIVPSLPASIASVRRFAVSACLAGGLDPLCDTLALLVSEVATNALVHGSGNVQVRVTAAGPVLRVEVADDSPRMPEPRAAGLLEEGGRGLSLVEQLSRGWGVYREGAGKVVWFELV
ncbi:MAG TPA: ATP-binding protein [Mycobacteriales bacterium]|nr:ATP-binding protein [Mycobacteriales bacterium]